MKAIILAAGQGTRLKKYTQNLPKVILKVAGKTLIERQIVCYLEAGIQDIIIIRGFAAEKITYKGISYYTNEDYAGTNMVESLMAAREEFDDDVVVSYSDIIFEKRLLQKMMENKADFLVAVDDEWKAYWNRRYGEIDFDTESLQISFDGAIKSLGRENPPLQEIDARYIGLLKFSCKGLEIITKLLETAKANNGYDKPWQQSGKPIRQAYMTDLLNALIESGEKVQAVRFQHGWLEFDTNEDYENVLQWIKDESIHELITGLDK